jgi:hypothetical protein
MVASFNLLLERRDYEKNLDRSSNRQKKETLL